LAFNLQTFKTRTLTAIVFAVVMLAGLLWNHWSFLVLFSAIHFGCWWEYFNLLEKIHKTSYHLNTRFGFMLMGFSIMLWFCEKAFTINDYRISENFALPVSAAGFILLAIGIFQTKKIDLKSFGAASLGLIYISLSWSMMIGLRQTGMIFKGDYLAIDFGRLYPCLIVFSIWINDTMAYIVGSLIGKTTLSRISPKKTWEGTIGGIILTIIIMGFAGSYLLGTSKAVAVSVALIASVFGTLGDLLESKLKRMAGVKDSGSFMPGHGGFLDRFDSLLLAIPAVWLFAQIFL
jgi:phosphatidate cytidylyltransferase